MTAERGTVQRRARGENQFKWLGADASATRAFDRTDEIVPRGHSSSVESQSRNWSAWFTAVLAGCMVVGGWSCSQRSPQPTALPPASAGALPAGRVIAGMTASSAASAKATPPAPPLEIGTPAPDVTLTLQDGFQLALSGLKGKLIVVYFCSSPALPGCVRQAHGFRDHWNELHRTDEIVVIGVSGQDAVAQRAFIAEHKLPFDLASDPDGRAAQAFKLEKAAEYGPSTYVIGRNAKIRAFWRTADPDTQTQQILAFAEEK